MGTVPLVRGRIPIRAVVFNLIDRNIAMFLAVRMTAAFHCYCYLLTKRKVARQHGGFVGIGKFTEVSLLYLSACCRALCT
jgi:hypothetical protein